MTPTLADTASERLFMAFSSQTGNLPGLTNELFDKLDDILVDNLVDTRRLVIN
jgi:hypothetical protein